MTTLEKTQIIACLLANEFKERNLKLWIQGDDEIYIHQKDRDGTLYPSTFSIKNVGLPYQFYKKIVERNLDARDCCICMEPITSAIVSCGDCNNNWCINCHQTGNIRKCPFCRMGITHTAGF